MDVTAQTSTTDDQELAKVLESMNTSAAALPTVTELNQAPVVPDLQFEETASTGVAAPQPEPVAPEIVSEPVAPPLTSMATSAPGDLESIKQDALQELRPLVDKLDLPPEEKFSTLLLIIRSTDDKTLVAQAHTAAKAIEDEGKRAEALLDVIKEIDYFSTPQS